MNDVYSCGTKFLRKPHLDEGRGEDEIGLLLLNLLD